MKQLGKLRGAAYALRVGDLVKVEADVTAVCLCGHSGPVDVTALLKRWSANERLSWIEDKLKCTRCKAVGASSFTIAWRDES
jgi:hypothetical protein